MSLIDYNEQDYKFMNLTSVFSSFTESAESITSCKYKKYKMQQQHYYENDLNINQKRYIGEI